MEFPITLRITRLFQWFNWKYILISDEISSTGSALWLSVLLSNCDKIINSDLMDILIKMTSLLDY